MSRPLSNLSVLASGLDHPEGVTYAPDGNVYATGVGGQVYRVNLSDNSFEQISSTGGFGLGIAADAHSNLYVCDMGKAEVVRVNQSGKVATYSKGAESEPFTVPNFLVFDASGNLYVSNSGGWNDSSGHIQKIAPGGKSEVWSREASGFTNGLALSPDGKYLCVVESNSPLISRIAILPDGGAGVKDVLLEMPKCVPDGIAFDVEGRLYIGCYAPDRVYSYTFGGGLEIVFNDWTRMSLNAPTNLAFAGPELDRLIVASLGGFNLMSADLGVKGAPLNYPDIGS